MNATAGHNMQPVPPTNFELFLQFIKDSWPMITGITLAWKAISEFATYFSKRQEVKLRELIKSEVNPQIDNLTKAINELREEIGGLKSRK